MKLSLITPSYNQLDWLRLCCASVSDQGTGADVSNPDVNLQPPHDFSVEHIIQDGESAGVHKVLDQEDWDSKTSAIDRYKRCVFIEKDKGMYDAINRGLLRSDGDICAWLNCDEQYLPGTLARVALFFDSNPEVDMLFGDAILVDESGGALSYRRTVLPGKVHTRLLHLNTLSCATFFRRSIVERGFLFSTEWRSVGDAVWIHSLIDAGIRMATLHQPLATFTFTGMNLSETSKGPGGEQDRWRRLPDAPPLWMARPASLLHRLKKYRKGAYKLRDVNYAIYTKDSPSRRVEFNARNVGYGWPSGIAAPQPEVSPPSG